MSTQDFIFGDKEFIINGYARISDKLEEVYLQTNSGQIIKIGNENGKIHSFMLKENKGYIIGFDGNYNDVIRTLGVIIRKYG